MPFERMAGRARAWLMAAGIAAAGMGGMAKAQDFEQMPIETLRAGVAEFHPLAAYILAARLLGADELDEAVFWFYAGQLRYRVLLSCEAAGAHPDEGVLFNAMSESVGRPINEYAFGDVDWLAGMLDEVLAWDVENDSGHVSKTDCAGTFAEVRAGLASFRDEIVASADEIRWQRRQNGLENRS